MSKKRATKIDMASTSFARWRAMLGLTQDEAAKRLDMGRRAITAYETGERVPDYCVRVTMQMLAHGPQTTAWPE